MVKGCSIEAGSKTMEGFVAEIDSEPIEKLREAGAIILGKTVTTEYGYGQALPVCKSPWDTSRYPGGSSVGSAVAVAVGSATAALGTDAGGSIRSPAAWNGIVGLKPTYGIVPKRGVISLGPTVDHPGPLTKTVQDAETVLAVVAAPRFRASIEGHCKDPDGGLDGKRLGIDRSFFYSDSADPQVLRVVESALGTLEGLGATLVDVTIAEPEQVMAVVMVLLAVDVSFAHQKWLREKRELYFPGTQLVLELGELISAMDYLRAVQFRQDFKWRMKAVFEEHALDGLVMSTSPMTAIPFEKLKVPLGKGSGALADRIKHVAPFNLTGQPVVSVPCGLADDGMPVGLQFVGKPYRDGEALRMAAAFEAATTWHELRPPI